LFTGFTGSRRVLDLFVSNETGNAILTGDHIGVEFLLSLNEGAKPAPAEFDFNFDANGNGDAAKAQYRLGGYTAPGESLVASKLNDRFTTSMKGSVVVDDVNQCQTQTELTVSVEVLIARGTVDTHDLTIDRNFWRRFAINIDGANIGCGLSGIRGRVVVDVARESLVINCENTFRLVGEEEPPPPGVDTPRVADASAMDAADE